jgi:hypothetical protein
VIGLLFILCLLMLPLGLLSRKLDSIAAIAIAVALLLAAGFRQGGFDYEEYIVIIDALRRTAGEEVDFEIRMLIAKDPIMLFFTDATADLSEAYWPVFLGFAMLSVLGKLFAVRVLSGRAALFLGLYTIFLAPGLEFAAIRAAAAVGLLLAALTVDRWLLKLPLFALSAAAHISTVILAGTSIGASPLMRRVLLLTAMAVATVLTMAGASLLGDFERASDFTNNQGTLGALAFPLVTLVIFMARVWTLPAHQPNAAYPIAGICLAVSLGLALPMVTVSFRFLELSWCLLLWGLCVDLKDSAGRAQQSLTWAVLGALLVMLSVSNIVRDTWVMALTKITF